MKAFLNSLPRMSGELDHVVDLRHWQDPEATAELASFEELRERSMELYDGGGEPEDEEFVKQVIRLIAESARVGRSLLDYRQRGTLENQIRFWRSHLKGYGIAVMTPSVWRED